MRLKEAIETLRKHIAKRDSVTIEDLHAAERQGIEALKRHQVRASLTYMDMMKSLPGETEED